jgi:hypothetical protein
MFKKVSILSSILLLSVTSAVSSTDLQKIMKDRGLTERDVLAAAKTYVPTGMKDEYYVFSSGGQSGQVIVCKSVEDTADVKDKRSIELKIDTFLNILTSYKIKHYRLYIILIKFEID